MMSHFLTPRGPPRAATESQMGNLVFHEKLGYNILLWDHLTVGKLGVWVPPRAPKGSKRFQMDHLLLHENLRNSILLWNELTMGKLGVSPIEGGQRSI